MEAALRGRDVAAVIMETIPATYGFPMPRRRLSAGGQGAVRALRRLLHRRRGADRPDAHRRDVGHHQAMASRPTSWSPARASAAASTRSAACWCPSRPARWLHRGRLRPYVSTVGGAELGCVVALKVLEICQRPEVRANVDYIATSLSAERPARDPGAATPTSSPASARTASSWASSSTIPKARSTSCAPSTENGVWAIFSTLDPRVLQWKPGLLLTQELCLDVLERLERLDRPGPHRRGRRMSWKTAHRSFYYPHAPEPADLVLPPAQTALLVIDVQNTYLQLPADPDERARWAPFHARMRRHRHPQHRRPARPLSRRRHRAPVRPHRLPDRGRPRPLAEPEEARLQLPPPAAHRLGSPDRPRAGARGRRDHRPQDHRQRPDRHQSAPAPAQPRHPARRRLRHLHRPVHLLHRPQPRRRELRRRGGGGWLRGRDGGAAREGAGDHQHDLLPCGVGGGAEGDHGAVVCASRYTSSSRTRFLPVRCGYGMVRYEGG